MEERDSHIILLEGKINNFEILAAKKDEEIETRLVEIDEKKEHFLMKV